MFPFCFSTACFKKLQPYVLLCLSTRCIDSCCWERFGAWQRKLSAQHVTLLDKGGNCALQAQHLGFCTTSNFGPLFLSALLFSLCQLASEADLVSVCWRLLMSSHACYTRLFMHICTSQCIIAEMSRYDLPETFPAVCGKGGLMH